MNQPAISKTSDAELVADALNEQGYLLHYKIVSTLQSPADRRAYNHDLHVEAAEVPVSLPNGDETRIDIVLRHGAIKSHPWRVVMECKRSARDYKKWVFFGPRATSQGPSSDSYYVEKASLAGSWNGQDEPPMMHRVERCSAVQGCQVFEYGIEVRVNRPGNDKRASATNAIEDAFQQVILGQVGLALKLREARELTFRLTPVVVTTADLISADFALNHVCIQRGVIEPQNLTLEARKWLAVNYRVNDVICKHSRLTTNASMDLAWELATRQVRTVFVVQAPHLHEFLRWMENSFG